MKKFIALLVTVAFVAAASAQYRNDGPKDFGYDKGKDGGYNDGWNKKDDNRYGGYSFSVKERDMQIAQINREYDRKVRDVRNRLFVSRSRKDQMVYALESQRRDEIKRVYAKFSDRRNQYGGGYNTRRY